MSATTRNYGGDQTLDKINHNGIVMEQRSITSKSLKHGANVSTTMGDNVIQEEGWTLDRMLRRLKFVSTMQFPTTAVSHQILGKFKVPQDLIINNELTAAPFRNFIFWNGDVVINAQMTASPTAQGCVMMVFVPLTNEVDIETQLIPNFSALSVNQAAYLFPNTNTAAEMTIKYNSPHPNLKTNEPPISIIDSALGVLYFVVFNPLNLSTNSSDNVSISVFSHFETNKFKVPRITGVQTIRPQSKDLHSRAKPAKPNLVDTLVDTVLPDNVMGDAIKMGASMLGFALDKPVIPTLQQPSKIVSTQYMNFSHGSDYIDKMTPYPSLVSTVQKDTFATTTDEMDLQYLQQMYSYLGTFEVDSTDQVGFVMASVPLNPAPSNLPNTVPTRVTLLQYLSSMFAYWTGNLAFKVQVISTMMQTCKVLAAINYDVFTPLGVVPLDVSASQYGKVIEINQGSNTFEFEIEYVAGTPQLMVPNTFVQTQFNSMGFLNFVLLNPLVSTNGAPTTIYFNVFLAAGRNFSFNTLTDSNQVLPYLYSPAPLKKAKKIIYKTEEELSSESDIEVVLIKNPRARPQSAAQPTITPMSNMEQVEDPDVLSPNEKNEPHLITAQQPSLSVRDFLKKYNFVYSLVMRPSTSLADVPGTNVIRIPISDLLVYRRDSLLIPTSLGASDFAKGILTHVSSLFRLAHGGFNFKIMGTRVPFQVLYQPQSNQQLGTSLNDLSATYRNAFGMFVASPLTSNARVSTNLQLPAGYRVPIHYVNGVVQTAEFSVPFSSIYSSVLLRHFSELTSEHPIFDLGSLYFFYDNFVEGTTTVLPRADIFLSISDETRFGTLFRVPLLMANSYQNGNGISTTNAAPDVRGSSNGNTLPML